MVRFITVIVVFACLLDAYPTGAQSWQPASHPVVTSLARDAGLEGAYIFNVALDSTGVAWFATSLGIARFADGAWSRFDSISGMPNAFIRAVNIDARGVVWVGTDQGIAIGDADGFKALPDSVQPASRNVRRIRSDALGRMWIASDSWLSPGSPGGLFIYEQPDRPPLQQRVPVKYVSDVAFGPNGAAYAMTRYGLFRDTGGEWQEMRPAGASLGYVWSAAFASDTLVVSSESGLWAYHQSRWTSIRPAGTGINFVRLADGTDGSVLAYDYSIGRIGPISGGRWLSDGPGWGATPIAEDVVVGPNGDTWICGFGFAIRVPENNEGWQVFPALPPPSMVDSRKRLWFASDTDRAVILDRESWSRTERRMPPGGNLVDGGQHGVWAWNSESLVQMEGRAERTYEAASLGLVVLDAVISTMEGAFLVAGRDRSGMVWTVELGTSGLVSRVPMDGFTRIVDIEAPAEGGAWLLDETNPLDQVSIAYWLDGTVHTHGLATQETSFSQPRFLDGGDGSVALIVNEKVFWNRGEDWKQESRGNLRGVDAVYRYRGTTWLALLGAFGTRSGVARVSGDRTDISAATIRPSSSRFPGVFVADGEVLVVDTTGRGVVRSVSLPDRLTASSALIDGRGLLWIGTESGAMRLLHSQSISETVARMDAPSITEGERATVWFSSYHVGENISAAHQFSFRIDGGAWSLFDRTTSYGIDSRDFVLGPHTIEVRSRDFYGPEDDTPAVVRFRVLPVPLQERWFFLPILFGIGMVLTLLAGVAWTARTRLSLLNGRLSEMVDQRTADLTRATTRLSAIIENAPIAIIVLDEQGLVEWWNRGSTRIFGFTEEDAIGKNLPFIEKAHHDAFLDTLAGARQGAVAANTQMKRRHKDGRILHVNLSVVWLQGIEGSSGYFIGMLYDMTEQVKANERLRELSSALQRVQEDERRKLARDLHDEVGALLTGLKMSLEADLDPNIPCGDDERRSRVAMTAELLNQIRGVSLALHPPVLDRFGLLPAIQSIADRQTTFSQVQVEVRDRSPKSLSLSEDEKVTAFRIVQEALTNAARHGYASNVVVEVESRDRGLSLAIEDDGRGFDPDQVKAMSSGIQGMHQRAEAVSGKLEIHSSPGSGTRVEAWIPISALGPAHGSSVD